MLKYRTILSAILAVAITSCAESDNKAEDNVEITETVNTTILQKVDQLNSQLDAAAAGLVKIAVLDHHRMAQEEGAYTPPAIASIYSNAKINTNILANSNPLVGLDLPFKFLCYSEADTVTTQLAFTSAAFIAKRHALNEELLGDYKMKQDDLLKSFDSNTISESNLDSVTEGFGIVKIKSDFDFQVTVERLKAIVQAQADTRWFGEIDYQSEAKEQGVELSPNILLLFGGPAPGAKAMMTTPKIGLDAFCQKLLVFENTDGEVWVAFNDIVHFSELYYGNSTKPQQVINQRLVMSFTKVISAEK